MNAPVTRRALLGATAVLGATALPSLAEATSPAATAAPPDAALFDLIARHATLEADFDRLDAEEDRLRAVALNAYPGRPEAMRWRPDDFPRTGLGVGLSDDGGGEGERWYDFRGVEWMRDRSTSAWFPGRAGPLGVGDEARRLEIVAAFDAWQIAKRAVDVSCGWDAASEAVGDAGDALMKVEAEILTTAPATLVGLGAKAKWALGLDPEHDVATTWARQVAADAVALATRDALGGAS